MILAMKLISLAFDLDSGVVRDLPSLAHYGGYLFHVGSVLFGPWISYHDYMSYINQPSERIFVSIQLLQWYTFVNAHCVFTEIGNLFIFLVLLVTYRKFDVCHVCRLAFTLCSCDRFKVVAYSNWVLVFTLVFCG